MSSITMSSSAQAGAPRSYLSNVGHAALSLLAALAAVSPSKAQANVAAERNDEPREVSVARLYRLARSYESVSPSLARELRAIAQRD